MTLDLIFHGGYLLSGFHLKIARKWGTTIIDGHESGRVQEIALDISIFLMRFCRSVESDITRRKSKLRLTKDWTISVLIDFWRNNLQCFYTNGGGKITFRDLLKIWFLCWLTRQTNTDWLLLALTPFSCLNRHDGRMELKMDNFQASELKPYLDFSTGHRATSLKSTCDRFDYECGTEQ